MVMPVGRSLVFSGSQAKNISYPTDHRQKIFRTLPQMAWGGEFFSSDIIWWLGDWTRLILHQLPLPRVSICGGDGILIGVEGDAELAGGDASRSVCEVVRVRVERSQMRTFLHQQIDGSLLRFAQ